MGSQRCDLEAISRSGLIPDRAKSSKTRVDRGQAETYRPNLDQVETIAAQHTEWAMWIGLAHRWPAAFDVGTDITAEDGSLAGPGTVTLDR